MRVLLLLAGFVAGPLAAQSPTRSGIRRVYGGVSDSIAHAPLAHAVVQLVSTSGPSAFTVESDSLGRFAFDSVPPGRYAAGFFHPALEDLAVAERLVTVEVADADVELELATPAAAGVLAATCPEAMLPDSSGLIVGRVVDASSGAPVAAGRVDVQWTDVVVDARGLHQERRSGHASTDEQGRYALCGIPTDGSLTVTARSGERVGASVQVDAPPERVLRQRVALALTALGDSARLRGRVLLEDSRKPLPGATISIRGAEPSTRTDPDGGFTLAKLPAGTQTLEVRAVGYAPRAFPVELRNGAETRADVVMDTRIPVLAAVQVFGKAPDMNAFAERMRHGMGHFVTQSEIRRLDPFDLTSVFRRIPGMRVVISPTGHVLRYRGDAVLAGTGGCAPTIFLNGMRVIDDEDVDFLVDPRSVTGIEVYGPAGAPAKYRSACASILVWAGMIPR
jgi:hypothetical protein